MRCCSRIRSTVLTCRSPRSPVWSTATDTMTTGFIFRRTGMTRTSVACCRKARRSRNVCRSKGKAGWHAPRHLRKTRRSGRTILRLRYIARPASTGGSSGRKKTSGLFNAQEFCDGARPQEETAVRGGGERGDSLPSQLRSATRCRTKARFSRLAVSHFQQAYAEIIPQNCVVGPQSECAPIEIGGGGIFAVQGHHLGQRSHYIMSLRRRREYLQKHSASLGTIVAFDMKVSKLHSQLDRVGRERKSGVEHRDGLVEASSFGELAGMFEKRRRKRRPARRGLAQLIKCLVKSPGGGQCRGKQGA